MSIDYIIQRLRHVSRGIQNMTINVNDARNIQSQAMQDYDYWERDMTSEQKSYIISMNETITAFFTGYDYAMRIKKERKDEN